jgi:phage tail-like protein
MICTNGSAQKTWEASKEEPSQSNYSMNVHEPAVTWKVLNSFPVRYSGPILNAKSGEVAMEELELAHEGIEIML